MCFLNSRFNERPVKIPFILFVVFNTVDYSAKVETVWLLALILHAVCLVKVP